MTFIMERKNIPLNIWVYTFCYNEMDILPFVVDYWKQYASKVIVYDNCSTDGSLKFLEQFDWIEVRTYDTDGKYDPEKILEMKNYVWKEARGNSVDFVMVCDLDEVLYPTNDLIIDLIRSKKIGITLKYSEYYESVTNSFPLYQPLSTNLLHDYDNVFFIKIDTILKCLLFNPDKVSSIDYQHYSRLCLPKGDTKSDNVKMKTLHLKIVGLERTKRKHVDNMRRCTLKNENDLFYHFYGKTSFEFIVLYNRLVNEHDRNIPNRLDSDKKPIIKQYPLTPSWDDEAFIEHNIKSERGLKCIVVIPVYKATLFPDEIASIKQCVNVLGDKYEICLVCPQSLDIEYYKYVTGYDEFAVLHLPDYYFQNTRTYSYMCEDYKFYKLFSKYHYMLIYLTDAWIFENTLHVFCRLNYDYIGSPWKKGMVGNFDSVGNGGLSLRKISKFIKVCKETDWSKCNLKNIDSEDLVFCVDLKKNFDICPPDIAALFSLTSCMDYWLDKTQKLPMGCHAWYHKEYWPFWKEYILF